MITVKKMNSGDKYQEGFCQALRVHSLDKSIFTDEFFTKHFGAPSFVINDEFVDGVYWFIVNDGGPFGKDVYVEKCKKYDECWCIYTKYNTISIADALLKYFEDILVG
jgi:hypothetical protein